MRRLSVHLAVLPMVAVFGACSPDAPTAPAAAPAPATSAPAAASVDRDPAVIPARFRGEWNADLSACGGDRSETRLRLGARDVSFYESTGAATALSLPDPDHLRLTLRMTGEGETWEAVHDFRLSSDGATLTDAGGLIRRRCP